MERRTLRKHVISNGERSILLVCKDGHLTIGEISALSGLSERTVSHAIDYLELKGRVKKAYKLVPKRKFVYDEITGFKYVRRMGAYVTPKGKAALTMDQNYWRALCGQSHDPASAKET